MRRLIDVIFSDKSVQNLVDINMTSIRGHSVTDVSIIPNVENLVKLSWKMTIPDDENLTRHHDVTFFAG